MASGQRLEATAPEPQRDGQQPASTDGAWGTGAETSWRDIFRSRLRWGDVVCSRLGWGRLGWGRLGWSSNAARNRSALPALTLPCCTAQGAGIGERSCLDIGRAVRHDPRADLHGLRLNAQADRLTHLRLATVRGALAGSIGGTGPSAGLKRLMAAAGAV